MAAQRYLFSLVCGMTALAALAGCGPGDPGTASGEEIEAAIKQAERDLEEAKANQSWPSGNEQLILAGLPF